MRILVVVCVGMLMACHSDPAELPFYGATTALNPGSEVRLTFSPGDRYGDLFHANDVAGAEDGRGIVFNYGPRSYQTNELTRLRCIGSHTCFAASRDPLDTCAGMLPRDGGSAYWEVCEMANGHTDSTDIIFGEAVNSSGQILYSELTGPSDIPVAIDSHTNLWLADPSDVRTRRNLPLMGEPSVANLFGAIQWSGANTFFAREERVFPDTDLVSPGAVVRGRIGPSGAVLSEIPGSFATNSYAAVEGGSAILVTDGSAVIRRLSVPEGAASVIGVLPLSQIGRSINISCGPQNCAVLASDSVPARLIIWRLDPRTGAANSLRSFNHTINAIAVSPASGRIVALEGANLFLLDLVVQ